MYNTLENVFNSTNKDEKYFVVEKTERKQFDDYSEPKKILEYYGTDELKTIENLLAAEQKNKSRFWNYRIYTKKKENTNFIDELHTFNHSKFELTAWLR